MIIYYIFCYLQVGGTRDPSVYPDFAEYDRNAWAPIVAGGGGNTTTLQQSTTTTTNVKHAIDIVHKTSAPPGM